MHELSGQRARRLLRAWRDGGPAALRAAAGDGVRWPETCRGDPALVEVLEARGALVLLAGDGETWVARFAGARLVEVLPVVDEALGRELLAAQDEAGGVSRLALHDVVTDGVRRLAVAGELDFGTGDELRACLAPEHDVAPRVELDLSAVSFIDAAGLHAIVDAVREAEARGVVIEVVRSSPTVVRLAGLVDEPHLLPPSA